MRRSLLTLVLAFGLTVHSGCGHIMSPVIPKIVQILSLSTEAQQIVDALDRGVQFWFQQNPDSPHKKHYEIAVASTRTALIALTQIADGTKALSNEQIDLALANFTAAFTKLWTLAQMVGVVGTDGVMRASAGAQPMHLSIPRAARVRAEDLK